MAKRRHDHQFQRGFLLCLPLLTLLSVSLPLGPARAEGENQTGPVTQEMTLGYLMRTLEAISDVLDFYKSQYTKVNLDGVIGMRMVQGTLKVLLQNLEARGQDALLPEYIVVDLKSVYNMSKQVADMTQPCVAHNEPVYYSRMWPTISDGMWELNYPTRTLPTSVPTWEYVELEHMLEQQSDYCAANLFGTWETNESCLIPPKCWENMTKLGFHRYSLTHQIFYLQLGQLYGCMFDILLKIEQSNGSQPSLLYLQDTFCLNILKEAKILANSSFPMNSRDLFMEQAGLCGPYGYWEFFRYSWLDNILSWQDKTHGCYKNKNWPAYLESKHRVKREEKQLDKGCLSHKSAVALMALGQYVRYLTEAWLPQNSSYHQLVDQLEW